MQFLHLAKTFGNVALHFPMFVEGIVCCCYDIGNGTIVGWVHDRQPFLPKVAVFIYTE